MKLHKPRRCASCRAFNPTRRMSRLEWFCDHCADGFAEAIQRIYSEAKKELRDENCKANQYK